MRRERQRLDAEKRHIDDATSTGAIKDPQIKRWGAEAVNEEQVEAQRLLKKREGDVFANNDESELVNGLLPMPSGGKNT